MEKRKPRPLNKEVIKKEIEPLGWVEEEESNEDKISEMINHIKNNEALLNEVKKEMEKSGEEDLEKALEKYARKKVAQHEETEKGIKERYDELPE